MSPERLNIVGNGTMEELKYMYKNLKYVGVARPSD
jgi:hypothetical protein